MTYPASILPVYDDWFNEPILTETQMEYLKMYGPKQDQEDIVVNMDGGVGGSWFVSKESKEIHQLMYEIATENVATTLDLDPPTTTWMSGTGWQSGVGLL